MLIVCLPSLVAALPWERLGVNTKSSQKSLRKVVIVAVASLLAFQPFAEAHYEAPADHAGPWGQTSVVCCSTTKWCPTSGTMLLASMISGL